MGEPNKPPCLDCYRTGSDCVLAGSRRGGNVRRREHASQLRQAGAPVSETDSNRVSTQKPFIQPYLEDQDQDPDEEQEPSDEFDDNTDHELSTELRNPSDALQILQSEDHYGPIQRAGIDVRSGSYHRSPHSIHHQTDQTPAKGRDDHAPAGPTRLAIDDYELVERALLSTGTVIELLQM